MGGSGSGRWNCHRKAMTVEACRVIDMAELARMGAFVPNYSGSLRWFRGEEDVASVGYTVRPGATEGLILFVSYRITSTGEDVKLPIRLETTPLHLGGCRWWGICPLVLDDMECGRRVCKFYLPPGGRYFGCRHCYRLTYESVQKHDKRVDWLRKHPDALNAIINSPNPHRCSQLGLALRALMPRRY